MPYILKGLVKLQWRLLVITYNAKIHLVNIQYSTQHMPTQHTFNQSNPNEFTQFGVSHLRTRLNERLDHIFFFWTFCVSAVFFFFLPAPWTVQTNTTHIQTIQSKWIHTIWGITFKNKVKWAFGSSFFFFFFYVLHFSPFFIYLFILF